MTKIIKQVTLQEIKKVQDAGKSEVNLSEMTIQLQAAIIVNVSVGTGYADKLIEYESPDGKIENIKIQDSIMRLLSDSIKRSLKPIQVLHRLFLPELIKYTYLPSEKVYARNVDRIRTFIQKIINDRRSGRS